MLEAVALDVLEAVQLDVLEAVLLDGVTPDGPVVVAPGMPSAESPSSSLESGLSTAPSVPPAAIGLTL